MNRIIMCLTLLCTFAILPHAAHAKNTRYAALSTAVDDAVKTAIAKKRLVGAVVMVAHNGTIVYNNAIGLADGKNTPMPKNALFRLSSVSKVYTTMAAAALIQQGKLSLDDPVTKWLPSFTPALPDGTKPVITVRQLMSHTAGLDYSFGQTKTEPYNVAQVSDGMDISTITLDENLRRIASIPLSFAPGSSWKYSVATDVLGAVIAKAHGTSLEVAMKELVTDPLGLKDSTFSLKKTNRLVPAFYNASPAPKKMKSDQFIPVGQGRLHFSPDRALRSNQFPSGGAGMQASAQDVMTLLETIRKGGTPIANPDLIKTLMTPQAAKNCVGPGTSFALGWSVITDPVAAQSMLSPGTASWGGVYGHSWFMDPSKQLTVVILTNTAMEGLFGNVVTNIQQAVYTNLPANK